MFKFKEELSFNHPEGFKFKEESSFNYSEWFKFKEESFFNFKKKQNNEKFSIKKKKNKSIYKRETNMGKGQDISGGDPNYGKNFTDEDWRIAQIVNQGYLDYQEKIQEESENYDDY